MILQTNCLIYVQLLGKSVDRIMQTQHPSVLFKLIYLNLFVFIFLIILSKYFFTAYNLQCYIGLSRQGLSNTILLSGARGPAVVSCNAYQEWVLLCFML